MTAQSEEAYAQQWLVSQALTMQKYAGKPCTLESVGRVVRLRFRGEDVGHPEDIIFVIGAYELAGRPVLKVHPNGKWVDEEGKPKRVLKGNAGTPTAEQKRSLRRLRTLAIVASLKRSRSTGDLVLTYEEGSGYRIAPDGRAVRFHAQQRGTR